MKKLVTTGNFENYPRVEFNAWEIIAEKSEKQAVINKVLSKADDLADLMIDDNEWTAKASLNSNIYT